MQKGLKTIYQDYKLWCGQCGYNTFNYGNFCEQLMVLYSLTTEYDRGLGDQIVIKSDKPMEYCPFEMKLQGGYLA